MKHLYLVRLTLLWATLTFLLNFKAFAQPTGATIYNPIDVGMLAGGQTYTDTKNNSPQYGYQNNIGHVSDDIFYRFSISEAAEVTMGLCGSYFDTYIHLLDANGNVLANNDDGGGCDYYYDSRIVRQLNPGTYYIVAEGWYNRSGNIIWRKYAAQGIAWCTCAFV